VVIKKQEPAPAVIRVILRVHEVWCSTKSKTRYWYIYITMVLKKIEKKPTNSQERKPSVLKRKICRFFKQVL
jgi:uncharacterized protein (DUF1800 family)